MENNRVYAMKLTKIYPMLVAKAEKKGRTKQEVDGLAKGKPMEKILRQWASPSYRYDTRACNKRILCVGFE